MTLVVKGAPECMLADLAGGPHRWVGGIAEPTVL